MAEDLDDLLILLTRALNWLIELPVGVFFQQRLCLAEVSVMTALGQSNGLFAAFSVVSFGGKVLYTLSGLRILVSVIFEILKFFRAKKSNGFRNDEKTQA